MPCTYVPLGRLHAFPQACCTTETGTPRKERARIVPCTNGGREVVPVLVSMRLEVLSTVALAKFPEGLLLNLADALPREVEPLANLLEC